MNQPKKFRKKPVVIEAIQFTGYNLDQVMRFMGDPPTHRPSKYVFVINTLEGEMAAIAGDWIIRGVQGEYYPCKPDIFDATYEEVA